MDGWGDFMASATRRFADEPWSNADLFFLASALSQGMSLAQAAGFLGRTEAEARKQGALMTAGRHRQNRRRGHRRRNSTPHPKSVVAFKAG
jgi:hypothetical protein